MAYNTVDFEPIQNVYETLVAYNNSSTDTYVPGLATCVPGSPQCQSEYGSTLIYDASGAQTTADGIGTAAPVYWSFEIAADARFYNPGINSTPYSVPVYPTDVMFSIARDVAWSDLPYATAFPGWIIAQALLPSGNNAWSDGGLSYFGHGAHAPYNNTPGNILGSMLINDSAYCPSGPDSNGCITFIANGDGLVTNVAQNWPIFLEFIADPLGGSIVPCGWFTYSGATVPGFGSPGANASAGDGSCGLPGGVAGGTTSSPAWTSYLSSLTADPTSWDSFEALANNELFGEAPQGTVINTLVGSGPYYMGTPSSPGVDPRFTGYALTANPDYAQPYACQGLPSRLSGGCWPAAGGYVPNVQVTYTAGTPQSDAATQAAYKSGALDLGGFTAADTSFLPTGKAAGYLNYFIAPAGSSYSDFFIPFNLYWSSSAYVSDDFGVPPNIPADFLTGLAAREFLATAFPYGLAYSTLYKTSGIVLQYPTGGPAPYGMNSSAPGLPGLYPTNVSYPGNPNATTDSASNPINNSGSTQSWLYWWLQGRNPSSPEYDPELAACKVSSPCTMEFFGEAGATDLNTALQDWAADIKTDTHGALIAEFEVLTFAQLIGSQIYAPAGQGPADVWNLGWAPDYANPYDYFYPMAFPGGTYPAPDDVGPQLDSSEGPAAAAACGHTNPTVYSNLVYWANHPLNDTCQGYAYDTANYWANITQTTSPALHVSGLPAVPLYYNLASHIYNNLSLYVWQGQANTIPVFAPWINPATIDINPTAGGTQLWFKIGYLSQNTAQITFKEVGLPTGLGAEWGVAKGTSAIGYGNSINASVTASFPGNATVGKGGTEINLTLPTGVASPFLPLVFKQPTSGAWYNFSNATVLTPNKFTGPTTVIVQFTALGNISITQSGLTNTSFAAPQWCATFTSTAHDPSPPTTVCASTSGDSPTAFNTLSATLPSGSYTVSVKSSTGLAGFGLCTEATAAKAQDYCVKGTSGVTSLTGVSAAISVPQSGPTGVQKTIVFYPIYETVTFHESGFPSGDIWSVTVQNWTIDPNPAGYTDTVISTGTSAVFSIQQNASQVYGFSVNSNVGVTGFLPSISAGYFAAKATVSVSITMIDPSRGHVTLYSPEAVRRTESLPTETK